MLNLYKKEIWHFFMACLKCRIRPWKSKWRKICFLCFQTKIVHKEIIFHLSEDKNIIFDQKEMSRKSTQAVNHIRRRNALNENKKKYPWKAINLLMWKNHRTFNFWEEIFLCSHQQLSHIEFNANHFTANFYISISLMPIKRRIGGDMSAGVHKRFGKIIK